LCRARALGFPGAMVLFSSFGHVDAPTPHGGPAFQGWRQGFGFGKAKGPGLATFDPSIPLQLRYTPSDDRCFAATPFWRRKWEVGQAASFGFGERPEYGKTDGSVAPNAYGDVSKQVGNTRNVVSRPGITLHPKFPSMEEKYRDLSWPKCGPGPGKYDTRIPAGQASWTNAVPNPSFSMQSRPILDGSLREGMGKPGPPDYETRIKPGMNSPIRKGTLYNITQKGRQEHHDAEGGCSPGPARYNVKDGGFNSKGLLEKILNVPVPPKSKWARMPQPEGEEEEEPEAEDYEGSRTGGRRRSDGKSRSKAGTSTRRMKRVESSPAAF